MSRPKFVPTEEQRRTAKSLAAFGLNQEAIAHMLELRSPKTLRKHFLKELESRRHRSGSAGCPGPLQDGEI